jgi:hypothetical protein
MPVASSRARSSRCSAALTVAPVLTDCGRELDRELAVLASSQHLAEAGQGVIGQPGCELIGKDAGAPGYLMCDRPATAP